MHIKDCLYNILIITWKNIIFAKDWFDGDEFYYKVIPLQTKDELDENEKELIENSIHLNMVIMLHEAIIKILFN